MGRLGHPLDRHMRARFGPAGCTPIGTSPWPGGAPGSLRGDPLWLGPGVGNSIDDMTTEPNGTGGVDADRLRDVQSWRRSRSDRMLAGVCGGVGRALNIDPVLIRVVVAVLTIAGGAGIPIYIAAWLLMPEEGSDSSTAQEMFGRRARPDQPWLWPVVIAVGVVCAVGISSSLKIWPFSFPGPLIAVLAIWVFLAHRKRQRRGPVRDHTRWGPPTSAMTTGTTTDSPVTTPPTGPSYPTGPSGLGGTTTERLQDGPQDRPTDGAADGAADRAADRPQDRPQDVPAGASAGTPVGPGPVWTDDDPLGLYVDDPVPAPAPTTAAEEHSCAKAGKGGLVKMSVLLLAAASTVIALASGAALSTGLAIGLLALGVGMVIGAFAGRTRGLLCIALPLSLAVAATATFTSVPKFGEIDISPTSVAANPTYEMGVGSVRVDLSKATIPNGTTIRLHADVGEIVLRLPENTDVTGTAKVSWGGELSAFGERTDGHNRTLEINEPSVVPVPDPKKPKQTVKVEADVKLGSIVVERG